jgi:hypothetical protein
MLSVGFAEEPYVVVLSMKDGGLWEAAKRPEFSSPGELSSKRQQKQFALSLCKPTANFSLRDGEEETRNDVTRM